MPLKEKSSPVVALGLLNSFYGLFWALANGRHNKTIFCIRAQCNVNVSNFRFSSTPWLHKFSTVLATDCNPNLSYILTVNGFEFELFA